MKTTLKKPRKRVSSKEKTEQKQTKQARKAIDIQAKKLARFIEESSDYLFLTIHSGMIHPAIASEVLSRAIDIAKRKGVRVPGIILDSDWNGGEV